MDFDAKTATALFNTAASLYGGYTSYKSQKEASELQKEASEQQARTAGLQEQQAATQDIAAIEQQRINERNTITAAQQNAVEEENKRKSQGQEMSEARARSAASGIALGGGSNEAFLTEKETVNQAERDWLSKANQSEIDAMKSKTGYDRKMADMQADSTRIGASNTRAGSAITKAGSKQTKAGAYGSLLGTAKDVFNIGSRTNWYGLA